MILQIIVKRRGDQRLYSQKMNPARITNTGNLNS